MKHLALLIILLTFVTIALLLVLFFKKDNTRYFVREKNEENIETIKEITNRVQISIREIIEEQEEPVETQQELEPEYNSDNIPLSQEYYYSEELEAVGSSLFEGREGSFPAISADYRRFLGFERYRKGIEKMGGRFFIYNETSGKIEREINFQADRLEDLHSDLYTLSPRPRNVANESVIKKFIEKMQMYEPGYNFSVVILFPQKIETYLIGALDEGVKSQGRHIHDFYKFIGSYINSDELTLRIQEGHLKNGGLIPLDITISFKVRT